MLPTVKQDAPDDPFRMCPRQGERLRVRKILTKLRTSDDRLLQYTINRESRKITSFHLDTYQPFFLTPTGNTQGTGRQVEQPLSAERDNIRIQSRLQTSLGRA